MSQHGLSTVQAEAGYPHHHYQASLNVSDMTRNITDCSSLLHH